MELIITIKLLAKAGWASAVERMHKITIMLYNM